jgi:hypothetical protein
MSVNDARNIDTVVGTLISEKSDVANTIGQVPTSSSVTPDSGSITNAITDGSDKRLAWPTSPGTVRTANKLTATNH